MNDIGKVFARDTISAAHPLNFETPPYYTNDSTRVVIAAPPSSPYAGRNANLIVSPRRIR